MTSYKLEDATLERLKIGSSDPEFRAKISEQQASLRKKAGRKPLPETEIRRNCLSIRFTDGELEFLKLVAEERNEELAAMVAKFALESCEKAFLQAPDATDGEK